ncbi:MAG: gas vesicle protein GvpN, partial [Candidatus Eisenbacteria bacterium]
DRETEVRIAMAKSGIPRRDAETIVEVVRNLRGLGVNNHRPTIRACIVIAKILVHSQARARAQDPVFLWACRDVLRTETAKVTRDSQPLMGEKVKEAIRKVCGSGTAPRGIKVVSKKPKEG